MAVVKTKTGAKSVTKRPGNKLKTSKTANTPKTAKSPKSLKSLKPAKPPTLKEKNALRNKIINTGLIQWKPVDIPDTLGDYSGFFGLEELEGVDVRMVDGKPEFIAKESDDEAEVYIPGLSDKKKRGKQNNKTKTQDKSASKTDLKKPKLLTEDIANQKFLSTSVPIKESVSDNEGEFTGFDDNETKDEEDQEDQYNEHNEVKEEDDEHNEVEEDEDDMDIDQKPDSLDDSVLSASVFSALNMPLPDDNDIDLPAWKSLPLSPYLLNGLQTLGFTKPTPIQEKTIPLSLDGKDVIGKATTGSGKTLAYGLPILEKYIAKLDLIRESFGKTIQPPAGVIFAPTRELAHQVADHLNAISKFSPLSQYGIVSITGGLSIHKQERLLSYGPGIIVATPGRFLELIEKNEDLCKRMAATDIVVLDEADRLLQDGHFEEFERILNLMEKSRDKKEFGWKWQTLVFSATFSRDLFGKLNKTHKFKKQDSGLVSNDEIIDLLAKKLKFKNSKPALVDANPKEIVSGQVTEALVECGATERDLYLYYFVLMYPGSTLVFANSVESVRRLVPFLENLQIPAFAIHSSMIQKQRLRSLERFKAACEKNKSAVLIATDVAARGLDIPNIDHVAHYHLPRSADIYIHRSGRTARAGKEGVSVMFCSPQEASGPLKKLRKLVASSAENTKFSTRADVKLLPVEHDLVAQIRTRVQIAAKLADASIAGTATRKEDSWLKQAAEDLGIENLSDVDEFEDDVIKKQRQRKQKKSLAAEEQKVLRYQLKEQLAVPLRKNHRRSYITSGIENLAHQIVSGSTSDAVLGRKSVKALDELKGTKNRIEKEPVKARVSKKDFKKEKTAKVMKENVSSNKNGNGKAGKNGQKGKNSNK